MVTSSDSPPIGQDQEHVDNQTTETNNFVSHKSTRKIDEAVKKMQALNADTAKHNNPQVVFLDSDICEQNRGALKDIELERQRIEREQANLISIIPATQHYIQDTSTETPAIETKTQQNIEDTTNKNNTADTRQTSTQDTNIKHTKDNELQLVDIVETKTHNSVTSSTTSQEYCTPPLSPDNDDISNPNTVELEELNETL